MFILVEVAAALLLIGGAIAYFMRNRRDAEREAVTERRVEAYIETIRRERSNRELTAMTDTELRDLLLSGAHNLRVQAERRFYLLFGGTVAALLAAVIVATEEGMRGFGIAILVGAMVLYGLNEFLGRRMREPLEAKGIDVERLRVE
jgi:Flp pilus assembly protein TadB